MKIFLIILLSLGGGFILGQWSRNTPQPDSRSSNSTATRLHLATGTTDSDSLPSFTQKPPPVQGAVVLPIGQRLNSRLQEFELVFESGGLPDVFASMVDLSQGERDILLPELLDRISKKHPEEALNWYSENIGTGEVSLDFESRASLLQSAFGELANRDPRKIVESISKLALEEDNKIALAAAGKAAVLAGNAAELLSESDRLADPDHKFHLRSAILAQWGSLEPEKARHALDQMREGEERANLVSSFAAGWLRTEPGNAATWYLGQTPESQQGEILREIVTHWSATDPNQTAEWLNHLPQSPVKDQGRVQMAHNAFEDDPEAALAWAASIGDAEQRAETWSGLFRSLGLRDPATARGILQNPSTSPELRKIAEEIPLPLDSQ